MEALYFCLGSLERKRIIHLLKAAGSYIYNTNSHYNKGDLQVTRRPQDCKGRTPEDYQVCPACKEMYSKVSLRRHASRCMQTFTKWDRNVMVMGRCVRADLHPCASETLRKKCFLIYEKIQ